MRAWSSALIVGLLLAGCADPAKDRDLAEDEPAAPMEHTPSEGIVPPGPAPPTAPDPSRSFPLLSEVDGSLLHTKAAEVHVPAGSFHLVRLVFDAGFWDEQEPWDRDAEAWYGFTYRLEGNGTLMSTSGFVPASWQEDQTFRPSVHFQPVSGDGWIAHWISVSCTGCDEQVPRHQAAWLIGSPTANVTARIGALPSGGTPDEFWAREPLLVRPDAQTTEALAAVAFRYVLLLDEWTGHEGEIEASWDATLVTPAGTAVERSGRYAADVVFSQPGITSWSLTSQSAAGKDDWEYSLDAPGLSGGYAGTWPHSPASNYLYGVLYPPRASAQGNTPPGPLSFTAAHTFTGQEDPSGLASFTYEGVAYGHAGIDLDALFEWDTSRPPHPDQEGQAMCTRASWEPGIHRCSGDPTLWRRVL